MNMLQRIPHYLDMVIHLVKNHGVPYLLAKTIRKIKYAFCKKRLYQYWINANEPSGKTVIDQQSVVFPYTPKISIIMRTHDISKDFLATMIESVLKQSYSHWELCIIDTGSFDRTTKDIASSYAATDVRINVTCLHTIDGQAIHLREPLSPARGDYITFLNQDDTLAQFALFEIAKTINDNPETDLLYSDEDMISDGDMRRHYPQFKPDWSPDTLRSYNYIRHLLVLSKQLLTRIESGTDNEYDLIFRATEQARKIVHIPRILYHERCRTSASYDNSNLNMRTDEFGKKIVADHLRREGMKGTVEHGLLPGSYKINYQIDGQPLVSIIIPNHNHAGILGKCVQSILDKSSYHNYEIVIADNNSTDTDIDALYTHLTLNSRIKLIRWNKPFNFSAINNFAARSAAGGILLFLNNDTEVINPGWIQELLRYALRRDVGAVGAKLYYPDGTIQHAGIILGIRGVTGHAHRYYPHDSPGYMGRLKVVQNVSAVTGACLMTRKEIFDEVSGFDEEYPLAFSDLDLCLKYRTRGYLNVWTPYSELYHDESKTRGYEDIRDSTRFREEFDIFKRKWPHYLAQGDAYYNINLTLEGEDFSIRI